MIRSAVSRRYAKALFELLEASDIDPMRAGLRGLSDVLTASTALKHVIASPAFSIENKVEVLTSVSERVGCPSLARAFLSELVAKNRVDELPAIAEAFADLADQTRGTKQVTVTSPADLAKEERRQIDRRLSELMKGQVSVTYQTNPALLGGLRIQIGSTVYDCTARNRLDSIRARLAKE